MMPRATDSSDVGFRFSPFVFQTFLLLLCLAFSARAEKLNPPPEAREGLRLLYSGNPDAAIAEFRKLQQREPENPRGYLLEANALWWKTFCAACEIRFGMIDAWDRGKLPEDERYLALCDKAAQLAETALKQKETAEMHFYAGMAYGLHARLHGLRREVMPTARAGKKGREHLQRAVQLDPNLADAYAGLGLYNYYVDTLSVFVKMIRFLLFIPGGNKEEGKKQLLRAMRDGEYTSEEARIYYALNLRRYELQYQQAIDALQPLAEKYPANGLFPLLLGDIHAKLGHWEAAAENYRRAQQLSSRDADCARRIQQVAQQALAALPKK